MERARVGVAVAGVGAAYLVAVSCLLSWWYVPVLREGGAIAAPFGGPALFLLWAGSGALGAALLAVGAAVSSAAGWRRVLPLSVGFAALLVWLAVWSTAVHRPGVFGVGGGVILLCFLSSCFDWARARSDSGDYPRAAADLRLAASACFFIAAWGLCGLLGAPVFLLRPGAIDAAHSSSAASTLATKVLVCLVLGWVLMALSQRVERRNSPG